MNRTDRETSNSSGNVVCEENKQMRESFKKQTTVKDVCFQCVYTNRKIDTWLYVGFPKWLIKKKERWKAMRNSWCLKYCSRKQGNETENRQGVALSHTLLSKDLTCLNDGRPTRLASRPGGSYRFDADFRCWGNMTKFEAITEHDSDHLPCIDLISKNNAIKYIKWKIKCSVIVLEIG